jgi:multiple sugar transport system permease protein
MAMTPVVVALFWKIMYDPVLGPVNYFLSLLGITGPQWLGSTSTAFISVVLVNIWEWAPFSFLVITAGLTTLPKDAYEAAVIDGATGFQILFRLTIPMLKQVLLTLILLRSIEAIKAFDLIFVMTKGGPGNATQVMPFYLYLRGFQWFDLGYAAALSVFLIVFTNILFQAFINKTGVRVFYE